MILRGALNKEKAPSASFWFSGILALLFPTSILAHYGVVYGPAVQSIAQCAELGSLLF